MEDEKRERVALLLEKFAESVRAGRSRGFRVSWDGGDKVEFENAPPAPRWDAAGQFRRMFGIELEAGFERVRDLSVRFLRMGRFADGIATHAEGSTVSMGDRSFAIISFFALVGIRSLGLEDETAAGLLEVGGTTTATGSTTEGEGGGSIP